MAHPEKSPSPLGPHVTDNSDRGPALVAGSIVLIAAASIAVTLRLLSRRLKRLSWAADDYLIVAALTFAYAMFITLLFCIQNGLGKKQITNIHAALDAAKCLYVFEAMFPVTLIATKLSILCLYKRIFTTFNRPFAWALYIIAALQVAWAISGFFVTVFQCWPINIIWKLEGGVLSGHSKGHCVHLIKSLTGLATINTVLNTALLILPMPMVWTLQMSRRQKIALSGVFALGCADLSASIARTYLTSRAINNPSTILWSQAPAIILSFVEPCIGIVCACLPTMRPLLVAIKGPASKIFSIPSTSTWSSLRSRTSQSTHGSGNHENSTTFSVAESIRAAISAKMPVGEGPLFTTRIHSGGNPQWPLRDAERALDGVRVTSDLEQSTAKW